MERKDIVKSAKYVMLKNFCDVRGTKEPTEDFIEFMKCHEGVSLLSEEKDLCHYECNEHHFTNKWIYENLVPAVFNLLDIKFNPLEYYKITNIHCDSKGCVDDFSFLAPYDCGDFEITCDLFKQDEYNESVFYRTGIFIERGGFSTLVPITQERVPNNTFYENVYGFRTTPYHTLYRCPHQCSVIKNFNCNNGRVLLLSCDSHSIPIISLLANYFEEVIVLDNRARKYSSAIYFINKNITDVLFVMSPINDLNKYTEQNLQ